METIDITATPNGYRVVKSGDSELVVKIVMVQLILLLIFTKGQK